MNLKEVVISFLIFSIFFALIKYNFRNEKKKNSSSSKSEMTKESPLIENLIEDYLKERGYQNLIDSGFYENNFFSKEYK